MSDKCIELDSKNDLSDISIENAIAKKHKQAYDYAMTMLLKEIEQSVEGMYHNLNSLR